VRMKKVVVVGNGMVGHRLCAKLRERAGSDAVALTAYGEEPRPAYDRVHLSSYFERGSAEDLQLAPRSWYAENDIRLRTGDRVVRVDRAARRVFTASGAVETYDELVLATGSSAFVPPSLEGIDKLGVFVYRTIEDLEAIAAYGAGRESGVVLGGGLLGLEAAKALMDLGLRTTVVLFQGNGTDGATTVFCKAWRDEYQLRFNVLIDPSRNVTSPCRERGQVPTRILVNDQGKVVLKEQGGGAGNSLAAIEALARCPDPRLSSN